MDWSFLAVVLTSASYRITKYQYRTKYQYGNQAKPSNAASEFQLCLTGFRNQNSTPQSFANRECDRKVGQHPSPS